MLNLRAGSGSPSAPSTPKVPTYGPFTAADIADLFAPLEQSRGAVLAVSGGPDSVALMLLASAWAKQKETGAKLFVATVDHGLRPESRDEAETVALWARSLGLPHQILTWEGEKPKARIQERARAARYALLASYARKVGGDYVLTAHHADDQAETILFRLLRGSGIAGLAGMPKLAPLRGLTHFRPLLDHRKEMLIAVCDARGQAYLSDPSNENSAFARTRLRRLLPALAKDGLNHATLLRLGRRAARIEAALDARVRAVRASLQATRSESGFSASIRPLVDEPEEILLRVIACELEESGAHLPLRLERLENLVIGVHAALRSNVAWQSSLAGMALALDRMGVLSICPENERRRGRGQTAHKSK